MDDGGIFSQLNDNPTVSTLTVLSVVALMSLLAHLLITSRTARATVLIPLVILLATSLGYDPVAFAFLSTAAAGFCLTLPVSAKPVAMFANLDYPTYQPRDLLRLSAILLPIHLALFIAFAGVIWPLMGLDLQRESLKQTPPPPTWRNRQLPLQAPPLFTPYFLNDTEVLPETSATATVTTTSVPSVTPLARPTQIVVSTPASLDEVGVPPRESTLPNGQNGTSPASEETGSSIPTADENDGLPPLEEDGNGDDGASGTSTPPSLPAPPAGESEAQEETDEDVPSPQPPLPSPLPPDDDEDEGEAPAAPPPAEPDVPSPLPPDDDEEAESDEEDSD